MAVVTPTISPAPLMQLVVVDQQYTIDVLAELASRRLPTISWHLSGSVVDQLAGQVGPDSDEVKRETVAAYAALLGAEPTERQADHYTRLAVTGLFRGVRVTVCAQVVKNAEMRADQIWEDREGARWRVIGVPQPGDQTRLYFVPEAATDARTVHVIDGVRGKLGPLTLVEHAEQAVAVSA